MDEHRPENEPNVLNSGRTAAGDVESQLEPRPCTCQRLWDANNPLLPSRHLPEASKGFYVGQGVPLYKAALNGDWEKMQQILNRNGRTILCCSLTVGKETALHVAVGARQATVVKELVRKMEQEDLVMRDSRGNTAFCVAVQTGSVKIAKILMERNDQLPLIRGADNKPPLYLVALCGYPEMVRFLYENFKQHLRHLNDEDIRDIFFACIQADLFDLAIKMLEDFEGLAWARDGFGCTAFGVLARKPSAFARKSSRTPKILIDLCFGSNTISTKNKAIELTKLLCDTISYDERKSLRETIDQAGEFLFEAARLGNNEFLAVLIGSYPDLIFRKDENEMSIFHIAVLNRHASIFKHIHNLVQKDLILLRRVQYTDEGNESILYIMLHLVAKLPSLDWLSTISGGAALQMRRELLWFKEVEKLTQPWEKEMRDSKDELTPRELFTKEHSKLRKAGEEWMKNTAESCMIVATLVTAVVFTVTSSLPGGNDSATGVPMNINKTMFHVFTVASAVALYSSIMSTLLFLSVFTSLYAEDDFLTLLPFRLAAGIMTLLLSMLAMIVAFAAIFFLAYHGKHDNVRWVPILASVTSAVPVIFAFRFLYEAVGDVFRSIFTSPHPLKLPKIITNFISRALLPPSEFGEDIFQPSKTHFW